MRVLSWNIHSGGKKQSAAIADAISRHAPDVVALTEYRPKASADLCERLHDAGWIHPQLTRANPLTGGVAVLSREPLCDAREDLPSFAGRMLTVRSASLGATLVVLYGPLRRESFADYWTGALETLEGMTHEPVLVVGDLNTGEPLLDGPSKRLLCSNYFAEITSMGYADLWRRQHGADRREYTWYGRVNPYRIDHAFGSVAIVPRVKSCHYSHTQRERGISDHSVMLIELFGAGETVEADA